MALNGAPLAGKVALVTGGTRGIGAAISRKLAAWGCDLYLNYVERDAPAKAILSELLAQSHRAALVKADIGWPEDIDRMLEAVRAGHGHLDFLIYNAASTVFRRVVDISLPQWEYNVNTNLRSLVLIAQKARPLWAGRHGRLITLSNRAAMQHTDGIGPFGAMKAGVEALTRSLSKELAEEGVVVNCVRPGTVLTDVIKQRPDFIPAVEREQAQSPWHRVTTPAECANTVALLCLDEADWICGQTIIVDGGWSVWCDGR
jgi:NAD(P)-dependent dehydrogenase (short-subunit alcohol dehydrogenase family)